MRKINAWRTLEVCPVAQSHKHIDPGSTEKPLYGLPQVVRSRRLCSICWFSEQQTGRCMTKNLLGFVYPDRSCGRSGWSGQRRRLQSSELQIGARSLSYATDCIHFSANNRPHKCIIFFLKAKGPSLFSVLSHHLWFFSAVSLSSEGNVYK